MMSGTKRDMEQLGEEQISMQGEIRHATLTDKGNKARHDCEGRRKQEEEYINQGYL